ncbi:hypothetical protein BDV25DRAFT_135588 [Aspergillus avenaceus]|uniref:Hydrophobic surface binding protein A-domain-containing protein n=1 Tax=Aspergillus avenaceus TaxID=36643 RepID=A0A5N6U8D2_ASPAV|nr:hypothetical protein BDV25DRAFT_135588 [Aspergillus avenaceus]
MQMQFFVSLLILTFLNLVTSTPLIPDIYSRDAATVLTDLRKVHTDLDTLSQAIVAYNGGLVAALDIHRKETIVERDLEQATSDTNAAGPFTASESTMITNSLLELEPNVKLSLDTLVKKKPLADQAGISRIVRMDLQNLQTKTGILSTALQSKATEPDKRTLATKTEELDRAFASAVAAFS